MVTVGPTQAAAAPTITPNPNPTVVTPNANPVTMPTARLQWLGHSTFVLTSSQGAKILIDPVSNSTGYTITPQSGVEVVTVSHEHGDHNNVAMATGSPLILRGLTSSGWNPIDQTVKSVRIRTVSSYHDNTSGTQRGRNTITVFEVDGLRIVHLGDLGHTLSPEAITAIGTPDVIMIPVGGFYTIDAAEATAVIDQLKPKIVIPMHYKTPKNSPTWPGATVDAFLVGKNEQRPNSTTITLTKNTLPAQTTVMIPNYE